MVTSAAEDAIALAASAGLIMDPWQEYALTHMLGERADGRWAAFESVVVVPRQNGKGSILEARVLAGLVLFNERLVLWSAHEFKTAREAWLRMMALFQGSPHLDALVEAYPRGAGEQGIVLKNGARVRFVARSAASGRGFTADTIIMDEAYELGSAEIGAMMPTLSTVDNPQIIYTSSAGRTSSTHLQSLRERGEAGGDPELCYLEWSAEQDASLDDNDAIAQANPAYPHRIDDEMIQRLRAAMPPEEFAREALGIWDTAGVDPGFPMSAWNGCLDESSKIKGRIVFTYDVSLDRSWAAVSCAGLTRAGLTHGEVVQHERGTGWVVPRLSELARKWSPNEPILLDGRGPAGSLIPAMEEAGIKYLIASTADLAQGCGMIYDLVVSERFRHLGQPALTSAVVGAAHRPSGDGAWTWGRKGSSVDISPLVSTTLAVWGLTNGARKAPISPSVYLV